MRTVTGVGVVLAAVLSSGCLVKIHKVERAAEAAAAFQEARAEIARIQDTAGPAHQLHVLVYDPEDREMVRVTLPLWLARKFEGRVDWDEELDGDDDAERVARRVRKHVSLKDLEKMGRGVLVEVEEHDGEQVLVWLQ
jgi:hypothetical protein